LDSKTQLDRPEELRAGAAEALAKGDYHSFSPEDVSVIEAGMARGVLSHFSPFWHYIWTPGTRISHTTKRPSLFVGFSSITS
jgi:hypothetical protein